MFLAGVQLPFALIIRELLSFLGIAPGQLMPNGWRYFLATFLLWPAVFLGEVLSISEFLNIYGPQIYPTSKTMTFMVRGKNQFIELGSTYSNNKHKAEQFFYIFGTWEAMESEVIPLQYFVPQAWGIFRESCEYSQFFFLFLFIIPICLHFVLSICRERMSQIELGVARSG